MLVAGDLLSHIPVLDQALEYGAGSTYDFTPMFHAVAPLIASADLSICHLETPVAPPGTPPDPTPPDYGVPAQIAAGIAAAGFDRCSLASNHVMDKGAAGIDATLAAFDAAGLGHAGMARTPDEAGPQLFDVNGITIAHLSYTFSYNGMPVANGEPWRSNLIDVDRIVAEARQAREHGARFVILSVHWGAEGVTEVTGDQRQWAEQITASGAVDVIVGHHAHVVQPIEQVNGRWVVFGLGNFLERDERFDGVLRHPRTGRPAGPSDGNRATRRLVRRRSPTGDTDLRRPQRLRRPPSAERPRRPRACRRRRGAGARRVAGSDVARGRQLRHGLTIAPRRTVARHGPAHGRVLRRKFWTREIRDGQH